MSMQPARHDPDRHPRIGPDRARRGRAPLDAQADTAPAPRPVEQPPALVMLLAPVVGLVIWGLVIWAGLVVTGH